MKKLLSVVCLIAIAACTPAAPSNISVEWKSEQTGTGEFGEPQMNVTLVNSEGTVVVDEECIGVVSPIDLQEEANVLTSVRCWWAGGGNDYLAATDANGNLTVKTRWVDEESGFGAWEELNMAE